MLGIDDCVVTNGCIESILVGVSNIKVAFRSPNMSYSNIIFYNYYYLQDFGAVGVLVDRFTTEQQTEYCAKIIKQIAESEGEDHSKQYQFLNLYSFKNSDANNILTVIAADMEIYECKEAGGNYGALADICKDDYINSRKPISLPIILKK